MCATATRMRLKLQDCCSLSAKRKLKQLSGKECRFAADVNHCISKRVVAEAKSTQRGLAVEELTGIHERVTVRKKQRAVLQSPPVALLSDIQSGVRWGFLYLRSTRVTPTESGRPADTQRNATGESETSLSV